MRRLQKNDFMMHVLLTYLDHNLSDVYIGQTVLLSRTKKRAQNKSDIFYVLYSIYIHIEQIMV